jgi:hypothetical protein
MRILDDETDKKLDTISLFLTMSEAKQLHSYLQELIENPKKQHIHMSSDDYQKEITLCVYNENSLEGLHERGKKLILTDE